MAEVAEHDNGKQKKGAQKKMTIRVDFTPMVDMNMLLITFFMLCTTMIKSQTLQIALPSNDKIEKNQKQNEAKASQAYTLILDTEWDENTGKPKVDANNNIIHNVYWYHGKPDTANWHQEGSFILVEGKPVAIQGAYLNKATYGGDRLEGDNRQGIRGILRASNDSVMNEYERNKQLWRDKKITKEQFDSISRLNRMGIAPGGYDNKIGHQFAKIDSTVNRPVVIIKPGPNATYEGLIKAIDEMNLSQISRYTIQFPDAVDTLLIQQFEKDHGLTIIRPDVRPKDARSKK